MRNIRFLIIMACFMSGLFYISCERTGYTVNKNDISDSERIMNREVDECEDCPNEDDCCCGIELQNLMSGMANLRICGTTDGASACSATPPSPCISIIGGGQLTGLLDSSNPKHGFCMAPGNSFYIQNLSSEDADITITCQDDITNPQTLTITIPGTTTYYFSTTNGCVVARCQ